MLGCGMRMWGVGSGKGEVGSKDYARPDSRLETRVRGGDRRRWIGV